MHCSSQWRPCAAAPHQGLQVVTTTLDSTVRHLQYILPTNTTKAPWLQIYPFLTESSWPKLLLPVQKELVNAESMVWGQCALQKISLHWTCCCWLALFVPNSWWKIKLQAPSAAVPPPDHCTNTASPLCFWKFKPVSTAIQVHLLSTLSSTNTTQPNPQVQDTYCLTKAARHATPPGLLEQNKAVRNPPCLPIKLHVCQANIQTLLAL